MSPLDDHFGDAEDAIVNVVDAAEEFRDPLVSEDAAALQFARRYENTLRFCHSRGKWFCWTGAYWRLDDHEVAYSYCREIARELAEEEEDRVRVSAGKSAFVSGVERFCMKDKKLAVTASYFDADPLLLGTPGGTVDLKTGECRNAKPIEGISMITAVAPDFVAGFPRWTAFLQEATGDDAELIRFLQQWCGYCLTGLIREHALLFLYGSGGNGKSVFINVISGILGDYARTAAMETFTASNSDRHPTDLAKLCGARLVTASETEESKSWAEARIKQLTGGDMISARFMRQDFFEYRPNFKLTIVGNHQPILQNVDDAMRRRFNLVGFNHKPKHPDRQLEEKLRAEWPAILAWMITGCRDWQENGLVRPQSVIAATEAYFSDQDVIGQWLEVACDMRLQDKLHMESFAALYASWSQFAADNDGSSISKKKFSSRMIARGFVQHRTGQLRSLVGIKLKR